MQVPFLVAKSSLPPGYVGGMLILFQLIIGILKFPAQVSGTDGNYSPGQLESPAKNFRNKLPLENCTPCAVSLFGNIGSIFLFPARLVFYYDYRLKRPCGLGLYLVRQRFETLQSFFESF